MSLHRSAAARRGVPRPQAGGPLAARIGVSACLLGAPVRFDGGHKRDPFLAEVLAPHVVWVPVCPEVEAGLGVPRQAMRLQRVGNQVRLVTTATGIDRTDILRRYATRHVAALRAYDLCGYVLKANSPSCGAGGVPVFGSRGTVTPGRGLFAAALLHAFPLLPVEEEAGLRDPRRCAHFVERVFAYGRLRALFRGRWTPARVAAFHAAHALQLMAHSPRRSTALGRLVAEAEAWPRAALRAAYETQFMRTLALPATPQRHAQVLQHVFRHLRSRLGAAARRELLDVIADYRRGAVPLAAPLIVARQHARRLAVAHLQAQTYLEPHPSELLLLTHSLRRGRQWDYEAAGERKG